jgi:hypothetical protein
MWFTLVLCLFTHGNALSMKKTHSSFCVLGMCIGTEKSISNTIEQTQTAKDETEELSKKAAELEDWHKQEKERKQQEEVEKKQKIMDEANFCTCGAWMCKLNDGSICWRKCCNNEFGGPPPTRAPELSADASKDPLSIIPGYIPGNAATGEKARFTPVNPADWRPQGAVSVPFVGDIDLGWLHDKVWPNHQVRR